MELFGAPRCAPRYLWAGGVNFPVLARGKDLVIRFQTTNSLSTTIKFHNGRHRVGVEGNIALARIGFGSGTPHSKRAVDEVNAVKSGSDVSLFSRRRKSLNRQFPYIVERLAQLPDGTAVDGELVAIDDSGHPDFHLLQNFRERYVKCRFYVVGGAGIPRAAHRAA